MNPTAHGLRVAAAGILLALGPQLGWSASDCPAPAQLERARLDLITTAGLHRLTVEIADTTASRAAGLMCRDTLATGAGMLLVYPKPQAARIWMKNTRVPLDIVFIAADGRVSKIVEQARPGEAGRISSDKPVTQVLELPAGDVQRYQLRVGDAIRGPVPGT